MKWTATVADVPTAVLQLLQRLLPDAVLAPTAFTRFSAHNRLLDLWEIRFETLSYSRVVIWTVPHRVRGILDLLLWVAAIEEIERLDHNTPFGLQRSRHDRVDTGELL